MSELPLAAARLAAAIGAAALGALIAVSFRRIGHLALCLLISFAAGALLAVAVVDLLPEAADLAGPLRAAAGLVAGYGFFWLLNRFVFHICPACSATHIEVNFKAVTLTMIAALTAHSFMDGFAVTTGELAADRTGMLVVFAVGYHKLPEGMAFALVARASGMSPLRAFAAALSVEAVTTAAGGLAGLALGHVSPAATGFALAVVSGGFAFIVFHALLSDFFRHHPRTTVAAASLGAAAIAGIGWVLKGI